MLGRQEEVALSFVLVLSGCAAVGEASVGDARVAPPEVVELGPTERAVQLTEAASSARPSARPSPPLHFEHDWRTVMSAKPSKPRLAWVRAEWSVASLEFERSGAFSHPEAIALSASFERVWVDVTEPTPELDTLLQSLEVSSVPSLVLLGCVQPPQRRVFAALTPERLTSALAECLDDSS